MHPPITPLVTTDEGPQAYPDPVILKPLHFPSIHSILLTELACFHFYKEKLLSIAIVITIKSLSHVSHLI
jgi:hypothetical protein